MAAVTVGLLFAAPAKFLLHAELPQPRLPVAGRADADEPRRRTRFFPPVPLGDNPRARTQQRASGQRVQRLLHEAAAVGRVEQDEIEALSPRGQIPQRAPDMSAPDLRPLLPRLHPHPLPDLGNEPRIAFHEHHGARPVGERLQAQRAGAAGAGPTPPPPPPPPPRPPPPGGGGGGGEGGGGGGARPPPDPPPQ